ncbi:MAG: hypothetical protein ABID87_03335 [Chloroflexota bacterium]
MMLDRDYYGHYEECLQCGYQHDLGFSEKTRARNRADVRYQRGERVSR